ncbi:MAG: hypothetical protein HOY69_33730 [Streptomyces sp.]|nr:hypothetical protein [Streptomyces sp.]
MPTDPLWLPSLGYDETEFRKMDLALAQADGTSLGARPGIRPGDPGLAVTLSGATVNVSAGSAILWRSGQGLYRAQLPASSPGSLTAANATFSRIDLVYLRVWDTAVDASGFRKADTVYLAGTASASPVAPTPGATEIYIPLATITVPSTGGGGTGAATVSSAVRQITVAPGGILPVSLAADIAASGLYAGQTRYNGSTGVLEMWTGTAWSTVNPPLTSSFVESSTPVVTSSTTWAVGSPSLSTTCIVPPSGRVLCQGQAQLYANTASQSLYAALNITGSTTATIRAAADASALRVVHYTGDAIVPGHYSARVTAVPGETLTAAWWFRVTGGGAQIDYRNITLIPLAG